MDGADASIAVLEVASKEGGQTRWLENASESAWAVHINCETQYVNMTKAMIGAIFCSSMFNANSNIPLRLVDILCWN